MIFILITAFIIIFVVLFTTVWTLFFNFDAKAYEKFANTCKNAIENGDYKKAQKILKTLSKKSKNLELKYQLGVSQMALNDYKKAKETFLAIIKIDREHAKSLTRLAEIERAEKVYDKALEYYLMSIQIDARNFENFTGIADIYYINNEYAKALEIYQKAKELAPEDCNISHSILKCKTKLFGQDESLDCDSIIEDFMELEKAGEVIPEMNLEIAKIYAKSGNIEKAQEYCQKILDENPSHEESLRMMGLFMLLKQDLDAAKDYLTKAFSANPENIETHNILSYVVSRQVENTPVRLCRLEYYNIISKYLTGNEAKESNIETIL